MEENNNNGFEMNPKVKQTNEQNVTSKKKSKLVPSLITIIVVLVLLLALCMGNMYALSNDYDNVFAMVSSMTSEKETNEEDTVSDTENDLVRGEEDNNDEEDIIQNSTEFSFDDNQIINGRALKTLINLTEYIDSFAGGPPYYSEIPEFKNINSADEEWLWYAVRMYGNNKYSEQGKSILTYDEVQNLGQECFGKNFTKKFPKEGCLAIEKNFNDSEENDILSEEYNILSYMEWPEEESLGYVIKDIKNTNNTYEVTIIEYLEEWSEEFTTLTISDLDKSIEKKYEYDSYEEKVLVTNEIEKFILESEANFSPKKLVIEYEEDTDRYHIQSCQVIN